MNDREKQILKILRRNPLIQQNEIADILQISRSRVAAHIMDLMRKGMIKGKGYILTEQDYCVVVVLSTWISGVLQTSIIRRQPLTLAAFIAQQAV
jgi:DNA-binding CsgD family transcriptional regulator